MADDPNFLRLLDTIYTNPIGTEKYVPARPADVPQQAAPGVLDQARSVVREMATPDPQRDYGNVLPISSAKGNPEDWRWDPKGGVVGLINSIPEYVVGLPERIHQNMQTGLNPPRTEDDPLGEKAANKAALNLLLDALPTAQTGTKPAGALGTFIGRESPAFNHELAQLFEALEAKNAAQPWWKFGTGKIPKEEMWRQTGTARTSEGLLQEISDHDLAFSPYMVSGDKFSGILPGRTRRLSRAIEHPEFEKAVPNMAKHDFYQDPDLSLQDRVYGWYSPIEKALAIKDYIPVEDARSIAAHELQHLADATAGRRSGTTPARAGSYKKYEEDIGEQRARETGERLNLTPEERRALYPKAIEGW